MVSETEGDVGEAREEDVEHLKAELSGERKTNSDLLNRVKYLQADLENLRKRTDREIAEASEASLRGLASRLIGVLDELELAVKHAEAGSGGDTVQEGLRMVGKNLRSALEWAGIERIDCEGRAFDPRFHEAVEKVSGDGDVDRVAAEVRPGYTFRGQVIRPSMVKVELARNSAEGLER